MAAKKKNNECKITEKDIVFDVVYERWQGYDRPGGLQTKAGMRRAMRSNLKDMRFIKGCAPKFTDWQPIKDYEGGEVAFAKTKCCFSCGIATLKKFVDNTGIEFEGETTGILGLDGRMVDAYSFISGLIQSYGRCLDKEYFKWAGRDSEAMYRSQNLHEETAYIGVKIPEERLVLAVESSYKKKVEDIKDDAQLNNLRMNLGKLTSAYTMALEWVREMSEGSYKFDKPLPAFEIDFREQDLFA